MIATNAVLVQTADIPSTEIDNEVVLMSADTGKYYSFAGTARSIWKVLEKPTTLTELCDSLMAQYDVDEQSCRRDVTFFVTQLKDQQLISVV